MKLAIEKELVEARRVAAAAGDAAFVRTCRLHGIAEVLTAVPCAVEVQEGLSDSDIESYLNGLVNAKETSLRDARKIRLYLAVHGHAWSQYVLGYNLHMGRNVERDYALARYWYEKAAERGESWAQNNLGNLYSDGLGGEVDFERAVYWYTKSAEAGDRTASGNLALLFMGGKGVKRNYRRAATLLKDYLIDYPYSARHHYLLAECHEHGAGGRACARLALHHYREAADFGYVLARKALRRLTRRSQRAKA